MFRSLLQHTPRLSSVCCQRQASTFTPKAPAANQDGKFWKITLTRSTIGLHPRTRENARVLGFKRRGHVVYRPITSELAGIILKLKEIVKVELVDQALPLKTRAADGFEVIGRMNPLIAPGSKAAKPLLALRNKKPSADSDF